MKFIWAALIVAAAIVVVGALAIVEFSRQVESSHQDNPRPARSEFHRSYALPAAGSVSIDDANGSIRVVGWDKESVQVDAVLSAPSARDLQSMSVSVHQRADALDITTNFPSSWVTPWWRFLGWQTSYEDLSPHVDYMVRVPSRVRVQTHSVGADTWFSGLSRFVKAESSSGNVTAWDIGTAVLETTSGDVTVTGARGSLDATTISGDILLRDTSGNIAASSTSGEVELYSDSGKVAATTTSGDLTARSFSGIGHLSSTSGDVSLTVRRFSDISVTASSVSGDIQSDVPMSSESPIELRTVSGDISVRYSD